MVKKPQKDLYTHLQALKKKTTITPKDCRQLVETLASDPHLLQKKVLLQRELQEMVVMKNIEIEIWQALQASPLFHHDTLKQTHHLLETLAKKKEAWHHATQCPTKLKHEREHVTPPLRSKKHTPIRHQPPAPL